MENIIARLRAEYQHKKDKRGWLKANKGIKIYWMCGEMVIITDCLSLVEGSIPFTSAIKN